LLSSGQYVELLQQTPRTAHIAQNLRWKHGLILGGPDALHFAAAIEASVDDFITTDERLKKSKVAASVGALGAIGLNQGCRDALPPGQLSSRGYAQWLKHDKMRKAETKDKTDQRKRFIAAAREAGCSEDEAVFDENLKKITRHKPPPNALPKPTKPKTKKPGQ
jgi:hypothetical protein